jgi:general secretion pathway protein G
MAKLWNRSVKKEVLSKNNQKEKKAFSLIELLVVILILGLLVGLVAPKVIGQGTQARLN